MDISKQKVECTVWFESLLMIRMLEDTLHLHLFRYLRMLMMISRLTLWNLIYVLTPIEQVVRVDST